MQIYINTGFIAAEGLPEVARIAEAEGYHGCTVPDHIAFPKEMQSEHEDAESHAIHGETPFPDTWVSIGAMAAVTTTLRLMSGVYLAPARPPVLAAKAIATAALISGGRVDCGLGLGWVREEYAYTGEDVGTRGRRLDEQIDLLRKIWSGDWVDHHGEFYDYPPFKVPPAPADPIPLWGSGHTERPLRRAAHLDGWIASGMTTVEQAVANVEALQRVRREEGTASRADYGVLVGLVTPPTQDECQGLAELGVTAVAVRPWERRPTIADPGLEVLRDALRRYAEVMPQR